MTFFKKLQTFLLVFTLILTISFPPVTKQAKADDAEIAFVADVEYIVGVFNIANLITGKFDFRNGWLENMSLRRVIRTDHGLMTMTIKSSQQWARVDFDKIAVRGYNLQPPTWSHLELLAPWKCPGYQIGRICAYDLWIKGESLETANMEIPDLVVETSFDPEEAERVLAMQRQIEEADLDEMREEMILAEDQMEGGKLSQQAEAYEQLQDDLPTLEKDADQLEQLLQHADEQSQTLDQDTATIEEIFAKVEELTETSEWKKQLIQAKQQQSKLTTNFEDLTITLDQVDELFKNIEDKLIGYQELIALRSEYLEELELGDWSETYQELEEIKKKLNEIAEKLTTNSEEIERLNEEKQRLAERIEAIIEKLNELDSKQPSEEMTEQDEDTDSQAYKIHEAEISFFEEEATQLLNELIELNEKLTQFNEDTIAPIQKLIDKEQWGDLENKLMELNNENNEKAEPIELFENQLTMFVEYKHKLLEKTEELNALKNKYKEEFEHIHFPTLEKQLIENASKIDSIEATIENIYSELTLLSVRSELEESHLLFIEKIIAVLEESYDIKFDETTD